MALTTKSEDDELTAVQRAISFQDFQRIWS